MAHLAYLEPDDELTTAAARIRETTGDRVAIVLPFNSRVATSRINFRLLAREAESVGRTLDVIAPDAAARALALSAGLRSFATVGEYEAAFASLEVPAAPPPPTGGLAPAVADIPATTDTKASLRNENPRPTVRDDRRSAPSIREPGVAEPKSARGGRRRASPLALGGILVLVVLLGMGGAAGAMLLPAAEITVTAKAEDLPAMTFTVTADPSVTAPDTAGLRIPARLVEFPVQVSGDYAGTGKHVTETTATGQVVFRSINTVFAVSVAKGTRVSTLDGVLFTTTATVVVPRATVTGSLIKRGSAGVGVTAVKAGTAGNVDAGAITQVPGALATQQIDVSNPAPTSGGTHTETVVIAKADVDAALKDLNARLQTAFDGAVAAPADLPQGTVSYPDTAVLGKATTDVDPATLPGTQASTFSLGLSATGSILAVDAAPITAMGQSAVSGTITPGYRLVAGSIAVQVGTGVASNGLVAFPVSASAKRIRTLDAAALRTLVLGRTEADARAALSTYGTVAISFWPGWVSAVPANADRVTVMVGEGAATSRPGASQSPVPSGS